MRQLRRMKSEAALLIALCDIGGVWPVMRVTSALTEIAVAAVRMALDHGLRQEVARGRLLPPNPDDPALFKHFPKWFPGGPPWFPPWLFVGPNGMKGMTDDAIEQFTRAIRLNPDLALAYFNLGNAYMHKGLVDQALHCFETAVRLSPDNQAFWANLQLTRDTVAARDAGKR